MKGFKVNPYLKYFGICQMPSSVSLQMSQIYIPINTK